MPIVEVDGKPVLVNGKAIEVSYGVVWGEITGDIDDQTDLASALDDKVYVSDDVTIGTPPVINADTLGGQPAANYALSSELPTDAEKAAWSAKADKPVIKTSMDSVAAAGTMYFLGTQSAVSVVLPSDAEAGELFTVVWYNGATPATLTVTGTVLTVDYTPSANSRSEINAMYDGTYWAVVTNEQAVTA